MPEIVNMLREEDDSSKDSKKKTVKWWEMRLVERGRRRINVKMSTFVVAISAKERDWKREKNNKRGSGGFHEHFYFSLEKKIAVINFSVFCLSAFDILFIVFTTFFLTVAFFYYSQLYICARDADVSPQKKNLKKELENDDGGS